MSGEVRVGRDGRAMVVTPDGARLPLSKEDAGSVREGARVTVELERGRKGRLHGRVVRRGAGGDGLRVGVLQRAGRGWQVVPDVDAPPVSVPPGALGGARAGQAVLVQVAPRRRGAPSAEIVQVLGQPDDPRVQIEMLMRGLDTPLRFDDEVEAEAAAAPAVDARRALAEDPPRRDLRGVRHVTIDGEDARDFDDAVAARAEGDRIRLWVSIADVSHYVTEGSALDAAAALRGNSVYLPHRALPMLPERLSSGLCSLRPHEPRLVLTCELTVDAAGKSHDARIYPALIESAARLTYTRVQGALEAAGRDGGGQGEDFPLEAAALRALLEASRRLRAARRTRGALDLELGELQVVTADGLPVRIEQRPRLEAHRLIEDLMIAANEAVARELLGARWPALYRVHDPPGPERLDVFVAWAATLGLKIDAEAMLHPKGVARVAELLGRQHQASAGHPLLLRALAQARYSVENRGHFGLASNAYLHFTSPIRRYPDLIVHRALRQKWRGQGPLEGLAAIAAHCSERERAAMESERMMQQLMAAQIALRHLGEVFAARVVGVTPIGAFVRVEEHHFEGLLPRAVLARGSGQSYDYVEPDMILVGRQSGHRIGLGDRLRVRLVSASPRQRRIDFEPAGAEGDPGSAGGRGAHRPRGPRGQRRPIRR